MTSSYGDIWADLYDQVHDLKEDIPFWVAEARASGGPVLELGCGTGRVAIPIAQAGVPVVGLDNSLALLKQARAKAGRLRLGARMIKLLRGDMRDFSLRQRFPLVIIPYSSFQVLLSVAEQHQALAAIRRHLAPGGRLIFDLWLPDLETLARDPSVPFLDREIEDAETGRRLLVWHQNEYDAFNQIVYARTIVEEVDAQGEVVRKVYRDHQMRYLHRYEAQHLLVAAGYRVLDAYGGFSGETLDESSERVVWVATSQA